MLTGRSEVCGSDFQGKFAVKKEEWNPRVRNRTKSKRQLQRTLAKIKSGNGRVLILIETKMKVGVLDRG